MAKFWSVVTVAIVALGVAVGSSFAAEKPKGEKPKVSPEEMFKKLDKNNDGFISLDEFVGKPKDEAMKAAKEKQFKAKDKDGDGKLSKEEFLAPPPAKKGGGKKK